MKTKKISIYDIARKLGVSTSTVSRALQDNPAISVEMRDRIRSVMRYAGPRMLTKHPVAAVRHLLGR